jgi:predicted PurR-regulated permease PerM
LNYRIRPKISDGSLAFAAVILLILVYLLRNLLVAFAVAAAFAYALSPLIRQVHQRTRAPRWSVALAVFLAICGVCGGGGWWAARKMYAKALRFPSDAPDRLHSFIVRVFGGEYSTLLGVHLSAQAITQQILQTGQNFFNGLQGMKIGGLVVGSIFLVTLFFVLLFYFLLQGPALVEGLLKLMPPEHRPALLAFARQANPLLLRYIQGLFVIVGFTAFTTWIGVRLIFHLPYAVPLALATGFLELLPVLGPTLSAFLLGGVATLHGGTIWTFLSFAIFCFGLRLAIDQIVGPIILGRAVMLSPVAVIFGFLAGGALLGMLGVLLAIPTLALLKILLDNYYAIPVD